MLFLPCGFPLSGNLPFPRLRFESVSAEFAGWINGVEVEDAFHIPNGNVNVDRLSANQRIELLDA